jgi:hypothetical protein
MSSGDKSKKEKTVAPATATSVFSGVKNSTVDLPGFGVGTTKINGDTVNTSFAPDAQLSTILDSAKQGVQTNQGIFNLTPEQQFSQVETNPYYQYASEQNRRFLDEGQAEARQAASQSGLENSTIAGAIEASLLNDASQQDLMARLGAIDYSRSLAGESLGINQALMDQIFGYTSEPTQLSNQTLMSAGNSQDQVGMFNAGQIQNARLANAQITNQLAAQRAAQRQSLIGSLIGAGGTLAGAALLAPMGGGASLGGKLIGGIGNLFTRK